MKDINNLLEGRLVSPCISENCHLETSEFLLFISTKKPVFEYDVGAKLLTLHTEGV